MGDEKCTEDYGTLLQDIQITAAQYRYFFPIMIIGWTLAGVLGRLIVCALTGTGIVPHLADLICAGRVCGTDNGTVRRMPLPL